MPDTVLIAEEMNMNKPVFILKEFMIWWGKIVGRLVISGDKCYEIIIYIFIQQILIEFLPCAAPLDTEDTKMKSQVVYQIN